MNENLGADRRGQGFKVVSETGTCSRVTAHNLYCVLSAVCLIKVLGRNVALEVVWKGAAVVASVYKVGCHSGS